MGFCTDDEYARVPAPGARLRADARRGAASTWSSSGSRCPGASSAPGSRSGRSTRCGSGSSRPTDLASLDQWDDYTEAKEAMFFHTDTAARAVDGGEEQRQEAGPAGGDAARAAAGFDYADKDDDVVGEPDPLIVGPAASVLLPTRRGERRRRPPTAPREVSATDRRGPGRAGAASADRGAAPKETGRAGQADRLRRARTSSRRSARMSRARRSCAAPAACPSGYAAAWPSSAPARCRRPAGPRCRRTCTPRWSGTSASTANGTSNWWPLAQRYSRVWRGRQLGVAVGLVADGSETAPAQHALAHVTHPPRGTNVGHPYQRR